MTTVPGSIVVLTGGIGGAKLVLGMAQLQPVGQLHAIVNTGDDFTHLGLPICPDLDTLMYTLAGEVNPDTGWGCRDETWSFMGALQRLGGDTWFRIGDRDLATHLMRAELGKNGATLSEATGKLCKKLGVETNLLPMSDDAVRTRVHTDQGSLEFQDYFVRQRAEPRVEKIEFDGADCAEANPLALKILRQSDLTGIVIAPSNPYLSIDPILSIPGIRAALQDFRGPVVAVTPLIGGRAVKGPTQKIMQELGIAPTVRSIAQHYAGLVNGFVLDAEDRDNLDVLTQMGLTVNICDTLMTSLNDKIRVARATLELIQSMTDSERN